MFKKLHRYLNFLVIFEMFVSTFTKDFFKMQIVSKIRLFFKQKRPHSDKAQDFIGFNWLFFIKAYYD